MKDIFIRHIPHNGKEWFVMCKSCDTGPCCIKSCRKKKRAIAAARKEECDELCHIHAL